MDSLKIDQELFSKKGSFTPSIEETGSLLASLTEARQCIHNGDISILSPSVARCQSQIKQSFELVNTNLRDVHKKSQVYGKSLDRRMKPKTPNIGESAELLSDTLLDRAIGMHFLREGHFNVAGVFFEELSEASTPDTHKYLRMEPTPGSLKNSFLEMYYILEEMKVQRNIAPAFAWARANSKALQARGSNLEFELARLQFIWILAENISDLRNTCERQMKAIMYARDAFTSFGGRYIRDIQQLMGSMLFCSNFNASPYRTFYYYHKAWDDVEISFTREFCSLLGLSADSPLFIAVTAGAIALPMLEKLKMIMKEKRTEWTTERELPAEIPLPVSYRFHSIFVCPVSKEQTTDRNPPMLLSCGHVIAQESLMRLSKSVKFKCPYCPEESHHKDARKVVL